MAEPAAQVLVCRSMRIVWSAEEVPQVIISVAFQLASVQPVTEISAAATVDRSKPLVAAVELVSGIPSQVLPVVSMAGRVIKISPAVGIALTVVKAIVKLPDWDAIT